MLDESATPYVRYRALTAHVSENQQTNNRALVDLHELVASQLIGGCLSTEFQVDSLISSLTVTTLSNIHTALIIIAEIHWPVFD
jgi:hypothetical protein